MGSPLLFSIVIAQFLGAFAIVSGVISLFLALFGKEVTLPGGSELIGDVLGAGGNVVTNYEKNCTSGIAVPILKFQVQNLSGGSDVILSIGAKNPPSSLPEGFACPLVNLCDYPTFTSVCLRPGKAVLNPTGSIACGSGAASSEWGRVKELYR